MIIESWRAVLKRSHAIRVQIVQALLGLFTVFDPGAALAVWNLMPDVVTARVPPAFVSAVGVVLFALALLTILLRLTNQPKLQAKIEEKQNEAA